MGFDTQDLLRQADYEEGDFLAVFTESVAIERATSTTSTSFDPSFKLFQSFLTWREVTPDNSDTYVKLTAQLVPGTGETVTAAIQNFDAARENLVTISTDSQSKVSSGWVEYEPTTLTNPIELQAAVKTDPGSNSSTLAEPTFQVGVEL